MITTVSVCHCSMLVGYYARFKKNALPFGVVFDFSRRYNHLYELMHNGVAFMLFMQRNGYCAEGAVWYTWRGRSRGTEAGREWTRATMARGGCEAPTVEPWWQSAQFHTPLRTTLTGARNIYRLAAGMGCRGEAPPRFPVTGVSD